MKEDTINYIEKLQKELEEYKTQLNILNMLIKM